MNQIMRVCVIVPCMLMCATGGVWSAPSPRLADDAAKMSMALPGRWNVSWTKDGTAVERIVRRRAPGVVPMATADAEGFIRQYGGLFGVGKRGDRLELTGRSSTPGGRHYAYRRMLDDLPIHGAGFNLHLDAQGRVVMASRYGPPAPEAPTRKPSIDAKRALEITMGAESVTATRATPQTEPVIHAHGGKGRHAWLVRIPSSKPLADLVVVVDAVTGKILERHDVLKRLEGSAQVFDPNPVVTTGNTSLRDLDDSSAAIPDEAYSEVTLLDLDDSGYLFGRYVSTTSPTSPSGIRRTSGDFHFDRGDDGFESVMAYYHLDRTSRYLVDIGYEEIVSSPAFVFPRGTADDNSFYSGINESLTFGTGGVDDAEDADIINHEFGHYIQDRQVKGFGMTLEGGSLGEGFSDYWAMSRRNTDDFQPFVGMWDATAYSSDNPPNLRRIDEQKRYPEDLVQEVHLDGEIWSATLYEVFQGLGRETTDRLALEVHELLNPLSGFMDAALALYTADQTTNSEAGRDVILAALANHGLEAYASAGEDMFVLAGEAVSLQGSGDYIGQNHTLTWRQVSGTGVDYQTSGDGDLTFTAPLSVDGVETLEFEIALTGEDGAEVRTDRVSILIVAPEAYQTESPGRRIPDNSQTGVTSQLAVSQTDPLTGIGIMVDVAHTYIGDLEIELTSPSGTTSQLKSSSSDESGVDLHFLAVTSFNDPSSEALLPFLTESPQGTWELRVSDRLAQDTGTLTTWGLFVMTGESDFVFVRPQRSIPDNGTVSSTLDIAAEGLVEEVQAYLDIEHTRIGDLRVELTSPGGVTVVLHNQDGGGEDRLTVIYHPDRNSTHALAALRDFDGQEAAGGWSLKVSDRATQNIGRLLSWGLKVATESQAPVADANNDGVFNLDDVSTVFDAFLTGTEENYDYNQDGIINLDDVATLFEMFLTGG